MSIYNLDNKNDLHYDIQNILVKIDQIYSIYFNKDKFIFHPKIIIDNKHYWMSDKCIGSFNKLVPYLKSLHKDMFAIIEAIINKKHLSQLKSKYPIIKEFRLLNNKFKHFIDKNGKITLTSIVIMLPRGHAIDICCNFKSNGTFKVIYYHEFIEVFLKILEDEYIITINRNNK